MNSKTLCHLAAAASAVVLGVAMSTPALAQAKAALTRDVDRSTAQPVNGTCRGSGNAVGVVLACTLYTVPPGKRLVVETVGYEAVTATGSTVTMVTFGQDDRSGQVTYSTPNTFIVSPVLLSDESGARTYGGTVALKMYLDENQGLVASDRHGGTANYFQYFNFSGYLVDK